MPTTAGPPFRASTSVATKTQARAATRAAMLRSNTLLPVFRRCRNFTIAASDEELCSADDDGRVVCVEGGPGGGARHVRLEVERRPRRLDRVRHGHLLP